MRKNFVLVSTITVLVILVWSYFWNWALLLFLLVGPLNRLTAYRQYLDLCASKIFGNVKCKFTVKNNFETVLHKLFAS